MNKTDAEWKKELTPEQYAVLRERGTEAPFSGEYVMPSQDGVFRCSACSNELFTAEDQHESITPGLQGWPSFSNVASSDAVELRDDDTLGMHRTEVICKKCESHLGHLFADENTPGGIHYCINSVCLKLENSK